MTYKTVIEFAQKELKLLIDKKREARKGHFLTLVISFVVTNSLIITIIIALFRNNAFGLLFLFLSFLFLFLLPESFLKITKLVHTLIIKIIYRTSKSQYQITTEQINKINSKLYFIKDIIMFYDILTSLDGLESKWINHKKETLIQNIKDSYLDKLEIKDNELIIPKSEVFYSLQDKYNSFCKSLHQIKQESKPIHHNSVNTFIQVSPTPQKVDNTDSLFSPSEKNLLQKEDKKFLPFLNEQIKKNLFDDKKASLNANTDYLSINNANKVLGLKGEKFVLNLEIEKLKRINRPDLSKIVNHVSVNEGDGLGYDIISFDEKTFEKIFIEVKTTTGKINSDFYLTINELNKARELSNYFIYRVYNFNESTSSGDIQKIKCPDDLETEYAINPILFRVKLTI